MSDDSDLKDQLPTQKRMDDMREKGQTLRSRDLSGGVLLFSAIIIIMLSSSFIKARLEQNYIDMFSLVRLGSGEFEILLKSIKNIVLANFFMVIQTVWLLFFVVFLSVFIMGGWNFSMKAVGFKFEKLSPMRNLSNIFSKNMLSQLTKSCVKFTIIVGVFAYFVMLNSRDLLSLSYLTLDGALLEFYYIMQHYVFALLVGVAIIVAVDAGFSYFSFQKQSKMTSKEIKDEGKDLEGDQQVKSKMRSKQMQVLVEQINAMVPQSTVVLTNPTHYAVALRYREGADHAPVVLAKGKAQVALHIRKLAAMNSVPIYEAPALARSIYHTSKRGKEINPGLYMAVAMVLAYINQLKLYQQGRGPLPHKSTEFDIPAELQF
jgi:flagellar biosynthetic protein FlhB